MKKSKGITFLTPIDMTISEFWDKVVESGKYHYDGETVFAYVNISDITEDELFKHSPFGSFSISREIDQETKAPISWYEIESHDWAYHLSVAPDKTLYDLTKDMWDISISRFKGMLGEIDCSFRKPHHISSLHEPDLYWFVKTYGKRLDITFDIYKDGLVVSYINPSLFS